MAKGNVMKLIEALAETGVDDLAALDAQIEGEETAIEQALAERRKKLDSLKKLRAVLDVKLNGKKQKGRKATGGGGIHGSNGQRQAPGGGPTSRTKIHDWLSKQDGPVKPATIAAEVELSMPTVYNALNQEDARRLRLCVAA